MRFKRKYDAVDYSSCNVDRQRMTTYLRAGGFRKIDGTTMARYAVERNRIILMFLVFGILGIGIYYAFMG